MLWPDDVPFLDPLSVGTLKVAAEHTIANLLGLGCDPSTQATWTTDEVLICLSCHTKWIEGLSLPAAIPKVQHQVMHSMVLGL
jgi:hypothetical protein